MKKNVFGFGMPALLLALGLVLAGCDTGTGGGTPTYSTDPGKDVLASAKSIQEKITSDTVVTKDPVASNSGKLLSAAYNTATGNYTLVYRIGRANNLFSHYVTGGIPGGAGYGLTYTTSKETVNSSSLNTTVSESVTVGAEVGVDAGVVVKASVEASAGVSISKTKTVEEAIGSGASYSYSFEKLNSDKLYAFALFSMLDFYQAFTYNKSTGKAEPIKEGGKPVVYYDILNMFSYQVCEYIPVEEIEFKTLAAWGTFTPTFSSADNAKLDAANGGTSGTDPVPAPVPAPQTSSSVYVYNGDSIKISIKTGSTYTIEKPVGLDITALKAAGYKNITVSMDIQFRAQDKSDGRAIWLEVDKSRVWEKTNINVDWTSWQRKTYTHSVPISSFKDDAKFRFGFSQENHFWDWTDEIWFFNEATVTFTAAK